MILFCVAFLLCSVYFGAETATLKKENNRCAGKSDIVLMVPRQSHNNSISDIDSFSTMEHFLIKLVNYFELRDEFSNIGLMIYRRTPIILNDLRPFKDRKQINTRISLMSRTSQFRDKLDGENNVSFAISQMVEMFTVYSQQRISYDPLFSVPKIAVLFLSARVNSGNETLQAAVEAKNRGITLYVVTSGLTAADAVASKLASDFCKMFRVKDFDTDLERILPHLANSVCSEINRNSSEFRRPDDMGNCHSAITYDPPQPKQHIHCPDRDTLYPDDFNCAYFYKCKTGYPNKIRCYYGEVFDAHTQTCNHRDAVTCYSLISCPTPTGLFPYPGDCRRFLNCYEGMPYTQYCPKELIFDAKRKRCSHFSETRCVQ